VISTVIIIVYTVLFALSIFIIVPIPFHIGIIHENCPRINSDLIIDPSLKKCATE